MPQKQYLDESGNVITGTSTYLDANGNPATPAAPPLPGRPLPPELKPATVPNLGDTTMGGLLFGTMNPDVLGSRVKGAYNELSKMVPGYKYPEQPQAEPNPQEDIGRKLAIAAPLVSMGGDLALDPLIKALAGGAKLPPIPTQAKADALKAAAQAKFNTVDPAAANIPVDLKKADDIALEALKMGGRGAKTPGTGSSLPKVFSDYIKQREASPEMTYDMARDFAKNSGRLSSQEAQLANGPMQYQVGQFHAALNEANRPAAVQVGMGQLYDEAMKGYRAAMTMEDKAAVINKFVKKAAITAALSVVGGGAAATGMKMVRDYMKLD